MERKIKYTGDDEERLTEIIFSFDTTGSMGEAIAEAKQNIVKITNRLFDSVYNLRIGLIAHGDYCDPKPAIFQVLPLTDDKNQIIKWINEVTNGGGGDTPENYEEVLEYAAHHANWTTGSHRVLVIIGDSYPHPPLECESQMKQYGLENPRKIDWKAETDNCWMKGIKIYGVRANCYRTDIEVKDVTQYFYESLAARTCGTTIQLSNFSLLTDMLLLVCFREIDADAFEEFRDEVEREGRMDEAHQALFNTVTA